MQFDAGNPIVVTYAPERDDTVPTCGGAANGFALQINYNVLGPREHYSGLPPRNPKVNRCRQLYSTTALSLTR